MLDKIIKEIKQLKKGEPNPEYIPKGHRFYKRAKEDNEVYDEAIDDVLKIIKKS